MDSLKETTRAEDEAIVALDGQDDHVGVTRQDAIDMAQQGKVQSFHRRFTLWPLIGFTACLMGTWMGVFAGNNTAMLNGGPPTLIYGTIFAIVGVLATTASLAEMASFAPTSGGQYHWVAMLAPNRSSIFLSWLTGWISTIGWQANAAAGVFFAGTMMQGLIVLNDTTYNFKRWHGTFLAWAALLVAILVNTLTARLLPKIEAFFLVLYVVGFLAVLIPLLIMAPKSSPSFVFQQFANEAGWDSNGVAFLVGLISCNLPLIGIDAPCHMAEEVSNASAVVPWAMVGAVAFNGLLGLGVCIAFSFTVGDLSAALSSATGYDFIEVFYAATNSLSGASTMTAIIITLLTCASVNFLAAATRQTWAFARDQGLPFSSFLSRVDKRSGIPLHAAITSTVVIALILLIIIGSTAAFNAIVSITTAGLYTSYAIPIALMVRKRIKGDVVRMGPWSMGKTGGFAINVLALCYLIISFIFSFFPPAVPVTLETMNWSCVMFGGVVLLGVAWFALVGRKQFHGPIVETR